MMMCLTCLLACVTSPRSFWPGTGASNALNQRDFHRITIFIQFTADVLTAAAGFLGTTVRQVSLRQTVRTYESVQRHYEFR